MTEHLIKLSNADLGSIALALRSNRLKQPISALSLQHLVPSAVTEQIASELNTLVTLGFTTDNLAHFFETLVKDRRQREFDDDCIDFVTTGPEAGAITNRDTGVVVRELFAHAKHTVLVAGYAVYQGQKVFQALADRMQEIPGLEVRLFLDIQRSQDDTTQAAMLVEKFRRRFCQYQWPSERCLPKVFYFPRSIELSNEKKACLHAKCVVVDTDKVFLSSANFTEAAQERNIELGVLIRSHQIAERVTKHFDTLVSENILRQLV